MDIQATDYNEILLQAVAVIENTRSTIAKQVNGSVTSAYWQIGKLLHERKVESGHGDGVVKQLSIDLKERYPKMEMHKTHSLSPIENNFSKTLPVTQAKYANEVFRSTYNLGF